jgi:hypothetical protein
MTTGRTAIWMHVARWIFYRNARIAGSRCVWGYKGPLILASSGLFKQRGAGMSSAPAPTSILQRFAHELAGMTLGGAKGAAIGTAIRIHPPRAAWA